MVWEEKIRKWIPLFLMCGLIFQFVLPARAQEAEIIVEEMLPLEDEETAGEIADGPAEVILDAQGISGAAEEYSKEPMGNVSAEVISVPEGELENTEKPAEDAAENPEEITWEIMEENTENKDDISSSLPGNYEISSDGCSASRKEEDADSGLQVEYHIYANPDIEEELDSEDFVFLQNPELIFPENAVSIADGDYKKFTSIEMAGTEVRQKLKEREPMFEIGYRMDSSDGYTNLGRDILNEAIKHTGKPTEGDYLRQTWSRMYTRIQSTVNKGIWTGVIQFAVEYYTSTEQEAAVDQKVTEIINDLKLEEKGDYEKIRAIYDYLCKNITYDHRYLESDTYHLDHSAYAALIQGTSVCSGYAYSFYRIALEEGIDTRVISGANHSWNIVKLENRYYNLDATWDAPNAQNGRNYRYFLKCPQNFTDHHRAESYATAHFNYQYPMADRDYDAGAPGAWPGSGICGEQLTWTLDGQGVLTIRGNGTMTDYSDENPSPWEAQKVRKVVIEEGITGIGANAFYYCTKMAEAVLPQSLKTIGDYAFSWCGSLKEIAFSQNLTGIGKNAFYECTGLTELSVPGTVKSIGTKAFYDAVELKKVTMEDGVKGLEEFVFQGCVNLKEVSFPISAADANRNIFTDCLNLADLTITGKGAIGAYATDRRAPWNRASLENLVIGNEITEIGEYAFYNMDGLQSVFIPGQVTRVGGYGFYDCDGLEKVTISDGVNELGEKIFFSCDGLTKITIPGSVRTVGGRAFEFCKKLKTVEISDGVEKLSDFAFYGCDTLQSVTIPAGTQLMNSGVFNKCPLLTQFTITGRGKMPDYKDRIRAWSFSTVNTVAVQNGITSVGARTFYNMDGLKSVILPESITKIEREAFANSDSLAEIKLPEKLKEIGEKAFYTCKSLRSMSIGKNVTKIGENAFYGSNALKLSVTYRSKAEEYAKANNIPYVSDALKAPEMKKAKNEKAGVKITWKKVSGAEGYRVFRKNGDKWKKIGDAKGGNNAVYTDKTVKSGTKYTYKVCALKNGKVISDLSANSADCLYLAPTSLRSAAGKAGKKAVVKWKKAGKGDGYELRFQRGKTIKKVNVKNVGTVQQTVKLQQAGTYEVSIRSYKKSGGTVWYSVWSNIKKVTVKK